MPISRDPRQLALPLDEPVTWLAKLTAHPVPVEDIDAAERRVEHGMWRCRHDPTMTREEREAVWVEECRLSDIMWGTLLASMQVAARAREAADAA